MKEKRLVLFDLDGTVTNPEEGISNGIRYAWEHMSLVPLTQSQLRQVIGPPIKDSFTGVGGLTETESQRALALYREYFSVKGLYENYLYPHMSQILGALAESKHLAIATSKPENYAKQIIDYFNLRRYFEGVFGSRMDGSRADKAEVIRYARSHYPTIGEEEIVMIGDREHDIMGANQNRIESIGVLYGFGTRRELSEAKATAIAEKPDDLLRLLS